MSTSPQPCNSTALAPRSSRFPYMTYLLRAFAPMAGIAQRLRSRFWSLPCAHSAVRGGFCPMFLLCCALANPRLYNTQPHDVTELKLCNSAKLWENSFAKYRTLRKKPQTQYSCGFADLFLQNDRFWKCLLTFWTTCYILYLSQILSVFAKYDTLRNFLSIGRKKHGTFFTYRVFVYSPAAYPPPTSSPRSQVYTQHTTSPSCSVYLEQP